MTTRNSPSGNAASLRWALAVPAVLGVVGLCAAALVGAPPRASSGSPPNPAGGSPPDASAGGRPQAAATIREAERLQKEVVDQMQQLESLMGELSTRLAGSDPGNAKKLLRARKNVIERELRARMREAGNLVARQNYAEAQAVQKEIITKLEDLHALLLAEEHGDKIREELARLEEAKAAIDRVIKGQQDLLDRTLKSAGRDPGDKPEEPGPALKKLLEALAERIVQESAKNTPDGKPDEKAAKELLEGLLEQLKKEPPPGPDGNPLNDKQLKGAEQALRDLLEQQLKAAMGDPREMPADPSPKNDPSGKSDPKGKGDSPKQDPSGKSGMSDPKGKGDSPKQDPSGKNDPSGKSGMSDPKGKQDPSGKNDPSGKSGMSDPKCKQDPSGKSGKSDPKGGQPKTGAMPKDGKTPEERAKEIEDLKAKQAELQEELRRAIKRLAEDKQPEEPMNPEGGPMPKGKAGGNQPQPAPDKNPRREQARKSAQQAEEHQGEAERQLGMEMPDESAEEQQRALQELERAKKALAEELQQLRKEQQLELLMRLEGELRRMLAVQQAITRAVERVDQGRGDGRLDRAGQAAAREQADKQKLLASDVKGLLGVLGEDAAAKVFPMVLRHLEDEMLRTARRLNGEPDPEASDARAGEPDTGEDVRRRLHGLELRITELIEAMKRAQKERKEEDAQQQMGDMMPQGGDQGPPPLVPPLAELKMLRTLQKAVNDETGRLAERKKTLTGKPVEVLDAELRRLSARQAELAEAVEGLEKLLRVGNQ